MVDDAITIEPGRATLADWRAVLDNASEVRLAEGSRKAVDVCQQAVSDLLAGGKPIYGVHTGFGKLA